MAAGVHPFQGTGSPRGGWEEEEEEEEEVVVVEVVVVVTDHLHHISL